MKFVDFTDFIYLIVYKLKKKRVNAIRLLELFENEGFKPFVYGSIARGDVHESSDIDIIFTHTVPSFQIEFIFCRI